MNNNIIYLSYALYNNALSLIREQNLTDATRELKQSVALYSRDEDILNLLGLCCYCLCDFNAANYYWRKSIRLNDSNNRAIEYIQALEEEEFKKLLEQYNTALDKINGSAIQEGIHLLYEITVQKPDLVEPYIIMGLGYYRLNAYDQAMICWQRAREKDTGNPRLNEYIILLQRKMLEQKIGKHHRIFQYIAGVLLLTTVISTTGYWMSRNQIQESMAEYNLSQQSIEEYKKQIAMITESKNKTEAENQSLLEELEQVKKENHQLIEKISVLVVSEKGSKNNHESIDMKVADERFIFNKAYALYRQKKYQEALEQFELLVEYGTEEYLVAEALYFTAICYEKLEQWGSAVRHYKKYIEQYPEKNYNDDSLYNCGLLLYRAGQKQEAKAMLQKLVTEFPGSMYVNSKVKRILKQ